MRQTPLQDMPMACNPARDTGTCFPLSDFGTYESITDSIPAFRGLMPDIACRTHGSR
jgi:hypothetical protein